MSPSYARCNCNRVDCDDNAKPANLANSAVLKLLEEEERQKQAGGKRTILFHFHHGFVEPIHSGSHTIKTEK